MHILKGTKTLGFIAHPRTGSQSTRLAFQKLGCESPGGHHGIDVEACQGILESGGIVYSTVRNPFDVIVSWYYYSHENVKRPANQPITPFTDWVHHLIEEGDRWVQVRWLENGLFFGAKHCNWHIRYEQDIQLQTNVLLVYCGLPTITLPRRGATERGPYQMMYNCDTKKLVQRTFEEDLREWGYTF